MDKVQEETDTTILGKEETPAPPALAPVLPV